MGCYLKPPVQKLRSTQFGVWVKGFGFRVTKVSEPYIRGLELWTSGRPAAAIRGI